MKKQYANYLEIVPAYGVTSVENNTVTLKSGYSFDRFDTFGQVQPSENSENTDAGTLYKFSLSVGVDKLSDTLKQKYQGNSPVILKLITGTGQENRVIGSVQNPVRLTWTPQTEYDELSFSRSSIFAVL
jgi:hypothetical protein